MLNRVLPAACTRLRVFLSYSSEQAPLAEEIAQVLVNDGHEVFFDKDSLPAAGDYHDRIRRAIRRSDRCIFLISKEALEPGRYTLTELEFIKDRWPSPEGTVFPVIVDPSVTPSQLPTYLRSVHAINIKGSAAAEVASLVEQTRSTRSICTACVALTGLLLMAFAGYTAQAYLNGAQGPSQIELLPIEKVHFRSRAEPPKNLLAADAPTNWLSSPLTVTAINVAYNHQDDQRDRGRLLKESIEIQFGGDHYAYSGAYIVEFLSDRRCPGDWLCRKDNLKPINIEPGQITPARETMFLPKGATILGWSAFIDRVLSDESLSTAEVIFRAELDQSSGGKHVKSEKVYECRIDVAKGRKGFKARGFVPGQNPRPIFWEPDCQKVLSKGGPQ